MTVDPWGVVLAGRLVAFVWEGVGGAGIMLAALAMHAYNLSAAAVRAGSLKD
jgi:hypothetical protein